MTTARSFSTMTALIALLAACSDDGTAADAATDTLAADSWPDLGPLPDLGPPPADGARDCRVIGTSGSATFSGEMGTVTSSFDATQLQRTITMKMSSVTWTQVDTWASLDDFITEASTIGRTLALTRVESDGTSSTTTTFTYDASMRLTKRSSTDGNKTTYSDWDSGGRPTQGTAELTAAGCTGVEVSIAYDDSAWTKTTTHHDPTKACSSAERVDRELYDAHGDLIGYEENLGTPAKVTYSLIYTESDEICL